MMKSVFVKTICAGVVLMGCVASQAGVIEMTSANPTYSQNFDGLSSKIDSLGGGWILQDATLVSFTSVIRSDGSSTSGGICNFGTAGATDRALGGLGDYFNNTGEGQIAGYIMLGIKNTDSSAFTGFSMSYTGEQWRNGGNSTPQTMVLEYALSGDDPRYAKWIKPGDGFNFTSPINSELAGALDGNAAANRITGLGGTISGINWAPDQTLWLRWIERNDAGPDHGLAIDDFTLTAVPEPTNIALGIFAGVGVIGAVVRRKLAKKAGN